MDLRVPSSPSLSLEESLVRLIRLYFSSHGPATVHDFAWWSGLTVNGLVVGGWGRKVRKEQVDVRIDLRVQLEESELTALHEAATSFGRFLGLSPALLFNGRT